MLGKEAKLSSEAWDPLVLNVRKTHCAGLKTEEKMRKATLRLQPRETLAVQKIKAEPCSHAVDLERYETRPAVALRWTDTH